MSDKYLFWSSLFFYFSGIAMQNKWGLISAFFASIVMIILAYKAAYRVD